MSFLGQTACKPRIGESWMDYKVFWFERMGYRIFDEAVEHFHASEARTRIVSAPARTTKSYSASADCFVYAMPTDPLTDSLQWIVGADYRTNKEWQYLWKYLVERRELHGLRVAKARNNPANGDCLIVLEHGRDAQGLMRKAVLEGKSAFNPQALQGEEVSVAVMSEAGEQPESVYTKYLHSRSWKILLPTTPKPHARWIKSLADDGRKDPSIGVDHFQFTRRANPVYNDQRYEEARRQAEIRAGDAQLDPFFMEQYEGKWVFYTGQVLPFRQDRHVVEEDPIEALTARRFISVDYGYSDPCVALFWAVLGPNQLYVSHDIYERRVSTPAFVDRITEIVDREGFQIDYAVGDPSKPEVARIMRDAGLPVYDRNKNALRDRAAGHRRLVDLLTEGDVAGEPGLTIHKRCGSTIEEWENLHYKDGVANEYGTNALDGEDHSFDAARYGVLSRPVPHAAGRNDPIARYVERVRQRSRKRDFRATVGL